MKKLLPLITTILVSITTYSQFCDTAENEHIHIDYLKYHFEDSIWYSSLLPTSYNVPFTIDTSISGIWQVGKPNKGNNFDAAYSGDNTIITDTVNNYPVGSHSYFDLKFLPYRTASLKFKYKIDSDTLSDGGYIKASYDNGLSWGNINTVDFDPITSRDLIHCTPYSDTLINGEIGISGNISDWTDFILIDLSIGIKSTSDTVIYRFHFVSDSMETNKRGWMIDDIELFSSMITIGIDEISQTQIMLSPNPSQDQVFIELKNWNGSSTNFSGEILNTSGQIVKQFNLDGVAQKMVSINELPDGIYFIRLFDDKRILNVEKLIKSGE